MDRHKKQMLFSLLRSAICGTGLTKEEINNYSPALLKPLLEISAKHDLIHLLAYGIKENRLVSSEIGEIERLIFKAVYRHQRMKYDYDTICEALEKAEIPFIPLKGSVIRNYYPEPWMRTSCDIDILVREEDTARAKVILTEDYGYSYHGKCSHDLSFYTPANTHIELHHDLLEDGIANKASAVLRDVWSMSTLCDGYSFRYEMTDEMLYFYHIAHMAKHFENGGCGIRPFIDLLILDGIEGADKEKRDALLVKGNLLTFANAVRKLAGVWFKNEEYDFISGEIEEYILSGGVFGTEENRVMLQQSKSGGKFRYAMSRIFLPYERLKYHYPILKKHKWLTPFMEVRRWFKLIFRGGVKRSVNELKTNSGITKEQAERTQALLGAVGL